LRHTLELSRLKRLSRFWTEVLFQESSRGHKRSQAAKVVNFFEPSTVHDNICTGRITVFVANDKRKNLKSSSKTDHYWLKVRFAVWNESSIVCKQQFTHQDMANLFLHIIFQDWAICHLCKCAGKVHRWCHRHGMHDKEQQRKRFQPGLEPAFVLRHLSAQRATTRTLQMRYLLPCRHATTWQGCNVYAGNRFSVERPIDLFGWIYQMLSSIQKSGVQWTASLTDPSGFGKM